MDAEQWNAPYPIGTRVMAYPSVRPEGPLAGSRTRSAPPLARFLRLGGADPCQRLDTVTRSVAWTLGHGAPVVKVEGETGGILLAHVDPIPADTPGGEVLD
ncbi:hypothetical protein ACPCSL_34030 [Streptomyces griseoincarnatus]